MVSHSGGWEPRVYAAIAVSPTQFAIALEELEYDDPFTAILLHDGAFSQPWTRIDVSREIVDIIHHSGRYIALSNEGDIYFIIDEAAEHEKIPGAGVLSEDAPGRGAMFGLCCVGASLIAVGDGAQAYRRVKADQWMDLGTSSILQEDGFDPPAFGSVAGAAEHDIYATASLRPQDRASSSEKAKSSDDWDDWLKDDAGAAPYSRVPEGRLFHWNGEEWRVVARPPDGSFYPVPAELRDVFVETSQRVWAVGGGGAILLGNAQDGFRDVSFHGDTETLLSVTRFRDEIIVASDYSLHRFDGHRLTPLKPKIDPKVNRGVPTPLKVQAVNDVMFYFDYKHGVMRWDGETWESILIPPELLESEFKGLR